MRRLDYVDDWVHLARQARYDANALAAALAISPSQLRRWFQEVVGCTPQDWLNELRLWHAFQMVVAGTPTKVIAADLNFGSSSHFCRHFLHYFKHTPRDCLIVYHRNLKNAQAVGILKERLLEPWKDPERVLLNRLRPRKAPPQNREDHLPQAPKSNLETQFTVALSLFPSASTFFAALL